MQSQVALLVACVLLVGCGASSPPANAPGSESEPPIAWRAFDASAFEEAARTNRLVFVNGSIEGCMACRWMEDQTYTHPRVRQLMTSFVPVTVDADVHPYAGQRLERWGWPALVFFTPEGRVVHAIRGNKRPSNFIPILESILEQRAAGTLGGGELLHQAEDATEPSEMAAACGSVRASIDSRENVAGGWGQTILRAAPPLYAFLRGHAREEPALTETGLRAARAYRKLLDPVWGGIFLETINRDWTEILYEKRTRQEAEAMKTFLAAYRETGDAEWLEGTAIITRHLLTTMRRGDGAFFTYQEDHAPRWRERTNIAGYFALDDQARREFGVPPVDRAVYTDINGEAIDALALYSELSGEAAPLEAAKRAAEALITERWEGRDFILHVLSSRETEEDDRMVPVEPDLSLHLRSQTRFGLGLLSIARVTGEEVWIDRAVQLAAAIEPLFDGRVYSSTGADETDAIFGREVSVRENAAAARFLLTLSGATHEPSYRDRAEIVLQNITPRDLRRTGMHALGELALALEEATLSLIEVTVVGAREDARSQRLFAAARDLRIPWKIARFQDGAVSQAYPAQNDPVAYVCSKSACSSPLTSPEAVRESVLAFSRTGPGCGGR